MTDLAGSSLISITKSVCPECLAVVEARHIARGENIYQVKYCPEHGSFETVIWRGSPDYSGWDVPKKPVHPQVPFTKVEKGCPFDCGLCEEHRQQPCCVLLEVTRRCDLGCPICFASAGVAGADPSLDVVDSWFRRLLEAGGPFNIQLSGGEPCLREDLPEIITLGKRLGFEFFQVNTNGLRIARDPEYLESLARAGLSTVFLQFDGTKDDVYLKIRGRHLLDTKTAAIKACEANGVGVVLVPTVVPGVNDNDLGDILRFALQRHPVVRGVHFQPISYFGRYPAAPLDSARITLPEVMCKLAEQSLGVLNVENFKPSSAENARCSFHGNYVVMVDGSLKALTRHKPQACCCGPLDAGQGRVKAQEFVSRNWPAAPGKNGKARHISIGPGTGLNLGGWEDFLERARTHGFSISAMAFQDAWNLDLERLKDCYILTMAPDGRLIPFCAYNLTSNAGQTLYRGQ